VPVHRNQPYDAWEERIARQWIGAMNAINVALYDISDGRVAGAIPSGLPLLLLTTTGRVTGRPRTVTVVYLARDDDYYVVASNGGLSRHPAWFANALADPRVLVQVGAEEFECTAEALADAEAADVIAELAQGYRAFDEYGDRAGSADRRIPVLRLVPMAAPAAAPAPQAGRASM
jgi:deazaflavin-dependent oxidoreductase (nitroreductase family)